MILLLSLISLAEARVYSGPIYADNVEDLKSLYDDGVLTEDDYETLEELLNDPINLNRARANELYDLPGVTMTMAQAIVKDRKEKGPFSSYGDLARVSEVTEDVLSQIVPFSEIPEPMSVKDFKGKVRVRTVFDLEPVEEIEEDYPAKSHKVDQLGWGKFPDTYLSTRIKYKKQLEVGFLGLAREGINDLYYDSDSRDFYGTYGKPMFEFGKAFVSFERMRGEYIVGSYTAGFGVGLTFDTTNRTHPDGWYADLSVSGSESVSLSKGLFGVSGHWFDLALNERVFFDATIFASTWAYDIYQYDVGVAGGEEIDPNVEDTDSPRIFLHTDDGYQLVGYQTIPKAYREDIIGANATVRVNEQASIGATAWVGHLDRTIIDGIENQYDIVLRSGFPSKDVYGAVGLDAAMELGFVDLRGEFSQSFTGGNAFLLKSITDVAIGEVEASLRRYSSDYDNPHARGVAAADEYMGMRDRDEQGARIKASLVPTDWLRFRLVGDLWQRMTLDTTNLELFGRMEVIPYNGISLVGFADHKDRSLADKGRALEYGGDYLSEDEYSEEEYEEEGDNPETTVVEGAGSKNYWGTQIKFDLIPMTTLTGFYKRVYEDAGYLYPIDSTHCDFWFQTGHYYWFKVQFKPIDATSISARFKYQDEDVNGDKGDRYIESYLQLDQKLPKKIKISLRGTLGKDLEDPESEWAGYCSNNGEPEMSGSCVCEDCSEAISEGEKDNPYYGLIYATAEWRF